MNSIISSLFTLLIFFHKERWIQSRNFQEVLTQKWSQQMYLSHLSCFFDMTKQLRSQKKQNSQKKKIKVSLSWIFFVIFRQFEFFEDIIEQEWFQLYTLTYIDARELTFKREKMMLWSYLKKLKTHKSKLISSFRECISQNIVQQLNIKTLRMCLMNWYQNIKNALNESMTSRWTHFYIKRLFLLWK